MTLFHTFKGINLSYREKRVMKGIFSLLSKQKATEERPFIILKNRNELFNEILDKTVTKMKKDGTTFKDFSATELEKTKEALEDLSTKKQQIIIKGIDERDKHGKPISYFIKIIEKESLIKVEYDKKGLTDNDLNKNTTEDIKNKGTITISILPNFWGVIRNITGKKDAIPKP